MDPLLISRSGHTIVDRGAPHSALRPAPPHLSSGQRLCSLLAHLTAAEQPVHKSPSVHRGQHYGSFLIAGSMRAVYFMLVGVCSERQ